MKVSVSNPEGDFYNFHDRSIETRKVLKTSLEQYWKIKLSAGEQVIMRVNPSMVRAADSGLQKDQQQFWQKQWLKDATVFWYKIR